MTHPLQHSIDRNISADIEHKSDIGSTLYIQIIISIIIILKPTSTKPSTVVKKSSKALLWNGTYSIWSSFTKLLCVTFYSIETLHKNKEILWNREKLCRSYQRLPIFVYQYLTTLWRASLFNWHSVQTAIGDYWTKHVLRWQTVAVLGRFACSGDTGCRTWVAGRGVIQHVKEKVQFLRFSISPCSAKSHFSLTCPPKIIKISVKITASQKCDNFQTQSIYRV